MPRIFQDGGWFGNFQTLISLLSYFLRLYNWLNRHLFHWAMLLVPPECSKPLLLHNGSKSQISPIFFFFFLSFIFLLPAKLTRCRITRKTSFPHSSLSLWSRMCNEGLKHDKITRFMNGWNTHTLAAGRHFEISAHVQNTSPLLGEIGHWQGNACDGGGGGWVNLHEVRRKIL